MEIKRICDVFEYQLKSYPNNSALAEKVNGQWKTYSTSDVVEQGRKLSTGLISLGLNPGDKVGIVSYNCPQWVIADLAISQIGCICVPMYPNSTADDYKFIIEDADVKVVFTGDKEIAEKIEKAISNLEQKPKIYTFKNVDNLKSWEDLLIDDQKISEEIAKRKSKINNEDLATIIYTSGTTGNPKGVMLSHKNILSNAEAVSKAFPIRGTENRTLSFLPLCHIFERTGLYTYTQMGVSIYYAESLDTIGENLKEIKPHFFATVPRVLEKVYEKILAKGYELKGLKKSLFFWALKLGDKYDPSVNHGLWYNLQLKIANKLIFSKWREALGGEVQFIVSGAAALQPRIARVFWSAQIKILEAYGLTETSPGISFSREEPENVKIGCVGPLLEGIEVKIADDGEILVKGPNVMMGYYKRPDLTAEVIDKEGWFHTGDIGKMIEGKFLKITDRKKEIFKTSGGKYIAPQVLENKFKESLLIEQIIVVGEGEKFPAALIIPSFESLKEWCGKHKLKYTTDTEMISNKKVLAKFDKELEKFNRSFAQYEKIKKFTLLDTPWTIEGEELTPTLKLKRKTIMNKYKNQIESIYS